MASQSGWTGELVLLTATNKRTIFIDAGTVIAAQTDVPDERLGETLYRFGVLSREKIDAVLKAATESGKRFGEVAVDLGFITPEQLYPMMARQVEEVFQGAIQEKDGVFYFYDRFDARSIGRRHNLPAGAMLMEAARRMDEMRFFRDKIPNDTYVPVPAPAPKRVPEECAKVFSACDGKRSVMEVGRSCGMLEFEVTRAVFQLINAGCVHVVAPRPKGAQAIVEVFNPALILVHKRCDSEGKGGELRDGLGRFATGGGIFDPLFMGAGPMPDGSLVPSGRRAELGRARRRRSRRVAHPADARLRRIRALPSGLAFAARLGGGARAEGRRRVEACTTESRRRTDRNQEGNRDGSADEVVPPASATRRDPRRSDAPLRRARLRGREHGGSRRGRRDAQSVALLSLRQQRGPLHRGNRASARRLRPSDRSRDARRKARSSSASTR